MADWNVCAGCGEELPDILQDADGKWWCTMPCLPESKGPAMKKFEVIVYLNEKLCMASQRNFTIECEYDLSLGDERACEIVEQECEERGYLANLEDYLNGGEPRELEGFDIIPEGSTYNSLDIVEVRNDDFI